MKTLIKKIIRTTRIELLVSVFALLLIPITGFAQASGGGSGNGGGSSPPQAIQPPQTMTVPTLPTTAPTPPTTVIPSPPATPVYGIPGGVTAPSNPGGTMMPVWESNAAAFFPVYFPALANYGYETVTYLQSLPNYLSINASDLEAVANYQYLGFPYLQSMTNYLYLLATYGQFFYQQAINDITGPGPYGEAWTVSANAAILTASTATTTAEQTATAQMVTNALNMTGTNANQAMASAIAIPGTDITGQTSTDNSVFNFDTLINPVQYTNTQAKNVANTLLFMTGATRPLVIPTLSSNPQILAGQLAQGPVQTFFLGLRNYITGISAAMSNLNYLAAERTTQPGLGTLAGYTQLPTPTDTTSATTIPDASPLQIEQFNVQRRINNSTWITQMNQADSTTLQRESLFLLAEISSQLFQLHMDSERIMATMSATQVGASAISKTYLNSASQQVQTALTTTSNSQ